MFLSQIFPLTFYFQKWLITSFDYIMKKQIKSTKLFSVQKRKPLKSSNKVLKIYQNKYIFLK